MEFKLNNLKYAWVGKELKHIASGNKYYKYFLDEDLTIPLVFCKGVKIKSYWRKEPNIDDSVIRGFFGSSESIEHYNKKIELSKSLELQFGQHLITGESSKVEYRVKSINKVIDLIFLDRNGDVLVGIEVFCTNKKTDEDIKKFNQVNFPIYEYNIHTGEVYPISSGCTNTEEIKQLSREIREVETSISEHKPKLIRGKGILRGQRIRIKRLEKGFKRIYNRRKKLWRDYYKFKEDNYSAKELEDKIREANEKTEYFRREIQLFNDVEEESLNKEIKHFGDRERRETESIKEQIEKFDDSERREAEAIRIQINRLENQVRNVSRFEKGISALNGKSYEYTSIENRNKKLREEIEGITKQI